jgi:hypothetical protein
LKVQEENWEMKVTNSEMLDKLKQARALLERTYVPWTVDDGKGGHCHLGCVGITEFGKSTGSAIHGFTQSRLLPIVDEVCRRLYSEWSGNVALRLRFLQRLRLIFGGSVQFQITGKNVTIWPLEVVK